MMLRPYRTSDPAADLLTAAEVKAQGRIDGSDEDTLIARLIAAATAHLDGPAGVLGRALITQTWAMSRRVWSERMLLPVGDVQSVVSVTYHDTLNAEQTLPASGYRLQRGAEADYLERDEATSWPSVYDRDDAITITWIAGYGDAASDVPEAIRHAALLLVQDWFEHREASTPVSMAALPFGVRALLTPYWRRRF